MPVKLGGRCIDLLTGTREINAGQIRGGALIYQTGTWEINAGQIRVPAH